MRVAIVTVGDELLAGDTVNTNASWLCGRLDDRGVSVERVTTVPDRVADIARVVNEYNAEYDAVIVTGGLGPTHDDVTLEGVAAAFGREIETNPEALEWLTETEGYEADDLVAGTAALPAGAQLLRNETGVAPGAIVDTVYVLPGVPGEMKPMFESIADAFEGPQRYTEIVTVDDPESTLIDLFKALRDRFDVGVGSYPGEFVRVKLTGDSAAVVEEAAAWLRKRTTVVDDATSGRND
ncbi:MAG: competence/damage-inducible protein A [Halobacteriota archaeon]